MKDDRQAGRRFMAGFRNSDGVDSIVDSRGKETGVLIDLKKHVTLSEGIYDNWLAEKRKHEPRESFRSVRSRLKRHGKLTIVKSKW
jgi:hypothetical protein